MSIRLRQIEPGLWRAAGRYDAQLSAEYPVGATVHFEPQAPRSTAAEGFWFATVDDAWGTLPDHLRSRFPEPTALRKFLLIKAGWCEAREFATDTPEAAAAVAAGLRWAEPYSIVVVKGTVVFAYVAKSQKRSAMGGKAFSAVTERALHALAELLGCDPTTLRDQAAA